MALSWPTSPPPDQTSQLEVKPRWKSCQFGDGYKQTAPDGINFIDERWSLTYSNLTSTTRTTIVNAIQTAMSTDYISWTPVGETVAKKWRLSEDGYTQISLSGDLYSVTVVLERIY